MLTGSPPGSQASSVVGRNDHKSFFGISPHYDGPMKSLSRVQGEDLRGELVGNSITLT